jgi:mitochondrial ATPase complex subunit ATP10
MGSGVCTTTRRIHSSNRASDGTAEVAPRKSLGPDISKPEGLKPHPLQLLPRPLGVPNPPKWTSLTKEERRTELLDEEKRKEKTAIL